jgi:hypothetical protein
VRSSVKLKKAMDSVALGLLGRRFPGSRCSELGAVVEIEGFEPARAGVPLRCSAGITAARCSTMGSPLALLGRHRAGRALLEPWRCDRPGARR